MVSELLNSQIVSPMLPWKALYKDVGLCLHFNFQLPTKFLSSLKILIEIGQEKILIWELRGYQGNKWNSAKVTWKPRESFKVNEYALFLMHSLRRTSKFYH